MTKVMLVEDDNNLREIYEARLQAEGYDIVAAKDGEEALVLAKEHKPELVISDVMMPKISGFEMLDILRNTDGLKDVKVIMLTALGQSDDQARADKLGADRYLVKSQVTLEDIVTVARELIDGGAAPTTPAPATDPAPASPAPEPVAAAPEPVAAPAEPVAVVENTAAQSTAQEEASVEAKIEDFVAGASTDPGAAESTPAAAPENTPEVVAQPAPAAPAEPASVVFDTTPVAPVTAPEVDTPEPSASQTLAEAATATDDKLMADAVDALMANTEANAAPATPEPPVIVTEKVPEPIEKSAAELGSVPINGKKVISPSNSGPAQPSLEELVAKEEAKNIQAGAAVPPAAPVTPTTVITPGGVDPNNIAL